VEVIELSEGTRERLLELFAQFPPVAIQSDAHLEAAQAIVDDLLGRERDEAEELYLDLLGTLVYAYEQAHVEMPDLTGLELIHALLAERDLTQRDLVRAGIFATASVASEVLAGKRSLTTDQVRGLAGFFRLPADLFLHETAAA
jgi:HTH-type transcriptional regulator / antitoxin HigA